MSGSTYILLPRSSMFFLKGIVIDGNLWKPLQHFCQKRILLGFRSTNHERDGIFQIVEFFCMFQHFVQNMFRRLPGSSSHMRIFLPPLVNSAQVTVFPGRIFFTSNRKGNTLQHIAKLSFAETQRFSSLCPPSFYRKCFLPCKLISVRKTVGGDNPVDSWNQCKLQSIPFQLLPVRFEGNKFISNQTSHCPVLIVVPYSISLFFSVRTAPNSPSAVSKRTQTGLYPIFHYLIIWIQSLPEFPVYGRLPQKYLLWNARYQFQIPDIRMEFHYGLALAIG